MARSKKNPLTDLSVPGETQQQVRGGKETKIPKKPPTTPIIVGPIIGTNIGGSIDGHPGAEEGGA